MDLGASGDVGGSGSEKGLIRVGSRKSQLAMIQTNTVIDSLKRSFPDKKFEVVQMSTIGDKILDTALSQIGEKSLFTRELEVALEKNLVDFVVHSLKDLPTVLPEGLVIGAVFKRDDPRDAVVMHPAHSSDTLATLAEGSVIGTSSLRRMAQLQRKYPHLKFESIRGNLNTRFKKLDEDTKYSAIILAVAGLERMNLSQRISKILDEDECMYAVSQGAMGVECRESDSEIRKLLSSIHDEDTTIQCVAERAFLRRLEGGCSVPVSTQTQVRDGQIKIKGGVFSIDGKQAVVKSHSVSLNLDGEPPKKKFEQSNGPKHFSYILAGEISKTVLVAAETVGRELAERLLKTEASQILQEAKQQTALAIQEKKAQQDSEMLAKKAQDKLES